MANYQSHQSLDRPIGCPEKYDYNTAWAIYAAEKISITALAQRTGINYEALKKHAQTHNWIKLKKMLAEQETCTDLALQPSAPVAVPLDKEGANDASRRWWDEKILTLNAKLLDTCHRRLMQIEAGGDDLSIEELEMISRVADRCMNIQRRVYGLDRKPATPPIGKKQITAAAGYEVTTETKRLQAIQQTVTTRPLDGSADAEVIVEGEIVEGDSGELEPESG